jgi:hypothetical protein
MELLRSFEKAEARTTFTWQKRLNYHEDWFGVSTEVAELEPDTKFLSKT